MRPGARLYADRLLTVDEFYDLIDEQSPAELDEGVIVMPPPIGYAHEDCFGFLHSLLREYAARTAREPDILLVAAGRTEILGPQGAEAPPDLVVKIIGSTRARADALETLPR